MSDATTQLFSLAQVLADAADTKPKSVHYSPQPVVTLDDTGSLTLKPLVEAFQTGGRAALLAELKDCGSLSVPKRQVVASAVSKAERAGRFVEAAKGWLIEDLSLAPSSEDITLGGGGGGVKHMLWDATPKAQREVAILFPGQGTQKVGMATTLLTHSVAKDLFARASAILGYDLEALVQSGPQEKLDQTLYSQPAIFVYSLAAMEVAKENAPEMAKKLKTTAGFSLGEYSALVFGGGLSFEDGLKVCSACVEPACMPVCVSWRSSRWPRTALLTSRRPPRATHVAFAAAPHRASR